MSDIFLNGVLAGVCSEELAEAVGKYCTKLEAENNKWLRLAQEFERENETLRELLIERDGGTHDADCKVHNPGIKRCNCGHAEVVELRSRLALDELLEERQEMESLATGNSLD